MTVFSWLHLTDIHLGMPEHSHLGPGIKDRFFEDLKALHEKCGPWDLVLFTGDLTFRGSPEEFDSFNAFLRQLWERLSKLGSQPLLLAVPGNHDLMRPDEKLPEVVALRHLWGQEPNVQSEFWTNETSSYRKLVNGVFANYVGWWEKAPFKPTQPQVQAGMLPGDFSAIIEKSGCSLGVVGLNSTFLQLTPGDYKSKLALAARQFQAACDGDGPSWVKKRNACLLLTHHPPDWLTSEAQEQLSGEITGYNFFAAHLFGHMHEGRYRSSAEGGSAIRRTSQGTSLFGLEYFEGEKKQKRSHGYSVGRIEITGDKGRLTFWPRQAVKPGGEWKFAADVVNFHLIDDEYTSPEEVLLPEQPPQTGPRGKTPQVLAVPDVERPFPHQWAFLVGVNDYQHFTKLQYCRRDAIDLAQEFRETLGFQTVLEFHEESELKPEREIIFQKLAELRDAGKVKPDDLFLFYFSGHGMTVGNKDYLLPIGARPSDVRNLGISIEGLVEALAGIGCKNTTMFIDACREAVPKPVQGAKGPVPIGIGNASGALAREAGIVAFFSCDPKDRSYEIEALEHGSFTYCILRAIKDGTVTTVAELDSYLREEVPVINVNHRKPPQQPYSVTAGREDLKILFNPYRAWQIEQKFSELMDCLVGFSVAGKISRDEYIKHLEFLDKARNKKQLDPSEETRLSTLQSLCAGQLTVGTFRLALKRLESLPPAEPKKMPVELPSHRSAT